MLPSACPESQPPDTTGISLRPESLAPGGQAGWLSCLSAAGPPGTRAREFSSDSLSAGVRLEGRSHGLTPGWACDTHPISECTSRITRRESFTPRKGQASFRRVSGGSCFAGATALQRSWIDSPFRLYHAYLASIATQSFSISLTDSLCRSHALTQTTRVETNGSSQITRRI